MGTLQSNYARRIGDESEKDCGMTVPQVEAAEFLALLRSLSEADPMRVERILTGVLSGRVTLTHEEALPLRAGDVMALADALPAESASDWVKPRGPS